MARPNGIRIRIQIATRAGAMVAVPMARLASGPEGEYDHAARTFAAAIMHADLVEPQRIGAGLRVSFGRHRAMIDQVRAVGKELVLDCREEGPCSA